MASHNNNSDSRNSSIDRVVLNGNNDIFATEGMCSQNKLQTILLLCHSAVFVLFELYIKYIPVNVLIGSRWWKLCFLPRGETQRNLIF